MCAIIVSVVTLSTGPTVRSSSLREAARCASAFTRPAEGGDGSREGVEGRGGGRRGKAQAGQRAGQFCSCAQQAAKPSKPGSYLSPKPSATCGPWQAHCAHGAHCTAPTHAPASAHASCMNRMLCALHFWPLQA